jgi:hypothetical protein
MVRATSLDGIEATHIFASAKDCLGSAKRTLDALSKGVHRPGAEIDVLLRKLARVTFGNIVAVTRAEQLHATWVAAAEEAGEPGEGGGGGAEGGGGKGKVAAAGGAGAVQIEMDYSEGIMFPVLTVSEKVKKVEAIEGKAEKS